ncbi:MAG TPA: FG-GAP-like repeat-containing protein [Smithellaceae bacterium]|nr:FG-GAP-like repeat-containing protein [Smithellaceae bacterium]
MKKTISVILFLAAILLVVGTIWAKEKYTVTVLPFSLHSAENIEYVRQGIGDMLISRISVPDKIEVTRKDVVQDALKKTGARELNLTDVQSIGQQLKSDYVVWGSITKIGSKISIDGKLVDVSGGKSDVDIFFQSQTLDEVIPKINDFSQRLVHYILGATPQATLPAAAVTPAVAPPPVPGASREAQIIAGMKAGGKKGTLTSMINPEFINAADPINRKNFWMSQQFKSEFNGMDVGDVNKDGLNEVVIIDHHNIYICQKTGDTLKLLKQIKGKSYNRYMSVDVADINKDGTPEIIVTSLNDRLLNSFVLQYKDGDYITIASDIRYFLRVIDTASGTPLLLGQPYGMDKVFETQIYEIVWRNGKYVSGDKMKIPSGLSIYGLTIDTLGSGASEKIIALDELDYLCIISPTNKPLSRILSFGFSPDELIWRSDEVYGGSNNYIANIDKQKPSDSNLENSAFANLRILSFDTNKDGKKELIIVKNLSSVGRVFKNLKLFSSSEIYNLEWDGLGMAENWRTKKINGYVADYCFKDIDNDGKPEIVLALVQSVGASTSERSVIVVYELEMPQ